MLRYVFGGMILSIVVYGYLSSSDLCFGCYMARTTRLRLLLYKGASIWPAPWARAVLMLCGGAIKDLMSEYSEERFTNRPGHRFHRERRGHDQLLESCSRSMMS